MSIKINKIFSVLFILIFVIIKPTFSFANEIIHKEVYPSDTNIKYHLEINESFKNIKKPVIALALGGGGARALINVGVIKALEEENIPFNMVSGTSMGAIIAGLYGSGISVKSMEELVKSDIISEMFEFNPPFTNSFINNKKFNMLVEKITPTKNLEDFPIPTALLSLDLSNEQLYVHTSGNIKDILNYAYTIPFIFPISVFKEDTFLIDPGPFELTPALSSRLLGADLVISTTAFDSLPFDKYNSPYRALSKMFSLMKDRQSKKIAEDYSDIIIDTDVGKYSFMDFHLANEFIELGYQRTMEKMPEIKKLLAENKIPFKDKPYTGIDIAINNYIADIKNDRLIWDIPTIKPTIYYGKDHTLFNLTEHKNNLDRFQFNFKAEIKRINIELYTQGDLNNHLELKTKLKQLTPKLDLVGLYGHKNSNDNYELSLLRYGKNHNIGVGVTSFSSQKYIHLQDSYKLPLKTGHLSLYKSINNNENKLLFYNKSDIPLNSKWSITLTGLYKDDNLPASPMLYRGNQQYNTANLQGSLAIKYNKKYKIPREIYQLIELTGYELYQFVDYQNKTNSLSPGIGTRLNLNILGLRPFNLGGYVSYDLEEDTRQAVFDVNFEI